MQHPAPSRRHSIIHAAVLSLPLNKGSCSAGHHDGISHLNPEPLFHRCSKPCLHQGTAYFPNASARRVTPSLSPSLAIAFCTSIGTCTCVTSRGGYRQPPNLAEGGTRDGAAQEVCGLRHKARVQANKLTVLTNEPAALHSCKAQCKP